ncbi:hypothetical protein PUS82_05365 [Cytobacillus firmus]|uniref:hypothetical protein n=1 Tax=Cytobacillus firmus TaxID=1399 RepID=UPI00237C2006|nr:hypothetical protein [Cytobacillus firmus]MDD9310732.1 hypothetical protein [Cytobacillus firmus]
MTDDFLSQLDEIEVEAAKEEERRTRTNQAKKRLQINSEEEQEDGILKGQEKREERQLISYDKQEKNEYIKIIVSVESSINKLLERFIADQKERNVKIYDNINQVERKISKSAWVNLLIENALRKEGYIID